MNLSVTVGSNYIMVIDRNMCGASIRHSGMKDKVFYMHTLVVLLTCCTAFWSSQLDEVSLSIAVKVTLYWSNPNVLGNQFMLEGMA